MWSLVRPANQRGEPLGVELSGTVNVNRRRARALADAGAAEGAYFAPLITNETGRPLTVLVNAGLESAVSCGCAIPTAASRPSPISVPRWIGEAGWSASGSRRRTCSEFPSPAGSGGRGEDYRANARTFGSASSSKSR